jgi:hypothetical protein
LTSSDPFVLATQKSVLIIIVTIAAILATLAIAFLTALGFELIKACTERVKQHRQKHKFELIPTYHNVRVLRHFETEFDNYSEETLPPPPTAPHLDYEFDTNVIRKDTVITFKDG